MSTKLVFKLVIYICLTIFAIEQKNFPKDIAFSLNSLIMCFFANLEIRIDFAKKS